MPILIVNVPIIIYVKLMRFERGREKERNIHSHPRLHQIHWPINMTELLLSHCNVMNHDQEASQLGEINVNKIELRRVLLLEEIGAKVRIE